MEEHEVQDARSSRERLLGAAIDVFMEKGYAGTGVVEIAQRAGLTTGAIYSNFPSKAALLSEAVAAEGAAALQSPEHQPEAGRSVTEAARLDAELLTGPPRRLDRLILESWVAAFHDADAARLVGDALDGVIRAIDDAIAAGAAMGQHQPDVHPVAKRTYFLALFLGAHVVRALDLPRADAEAMTVLMERIIRSMSVDAAT